MKKQSSGFGLIELMVALALGLIVLLGVTQIFISAKNTYLAQNAAASMQEDARYGLSKMLQEVRMVGMFGCLNTITPDASALLAGWVDPSLSPAISYSTSTTGGVTTQVLTMVTGDVGANGGAPTWTILTDCLTLSTVYGGAKAAAAGQIAVPIRKVIYTYNSSTKQLTTTLNGTAYVLLSNVSGFAVMFGVTSGTTVPSPVTSYTFAPGTPAQIRSVRISLTLTDPNGRLADRTFTAAAAIRNRLP